MCQYQYLIPTETSSVRVGLTAAGRISIEQEGITVYLTGKEWESVKTAVDSLHAPDTPTCVSPAKAGR